jgi:hypothetical protein
MRIPLAVTVVAGTPRHLALAGTAPQTYNETQ